MSANKITDLIHHPYQPPEGFEAPQIGVHKASTVIFPNVAAMRSRDWKNKSGYTYGLHGTPTTFTLEERIASLEGGLQCVLVPSGLAAIVAVDIALLGQGDDMLLPHNVYGARLGLTQEELPRFGITTRYYDAMDAADLAAKITPKTKLVWLEAPGSVTMEFPDLPALVRICREKAVICALDNTWGAGLAFNAFDLDGQGLTVDISSQALTKYPSGGGDVLMGSIVTRDEALHHKIKLSHMRLGYGVAANDAELVLRSLPSIGIRYRAADQSARQLAHWLKTRPEVEAVLHPAIEGAPGHQNWQNLCRKRPVAGIESARSATDLIANEHRSEGYAAGLFSIVFHEKFSPSQVDAFVDALKLFKIGYSWGGHLSLAVPYDIASMRNQNVAHWPYRGGLVRFSIGFEEAADLMQDLSQAFHALTKLREN
ncbi:PLP-dependent transferase [Variovorax sp. PCZ-1]|uniref:PLP-dependent transferase n=1 Tax=Variovorax sp. PCZ-1 TaxID=2835533 RepID=UPI001BCC9A2D|nr:PLP-dependent transferase [Variovorax sp. PCZ-1]MBS7807805.1 PLP-dependent transferase [Variovorax sp. PCZ-1]